MLSEWRKIAQKKNVLLLAVILGINLFFLVLHTYGGKDGFPTALSGNLLRDGRHVKSGEI